MVLGNRASNTSALRQATFASINPTLTAPLLTVYPTVGDSLSPKYSSDDMEEKPHRDGHSEGLRGVRNGFRGCVSQVRILPGPLLALRLIYVADG